MDSKKFIEFKRKVDVKKAELREKAESESKVERTKRLIRKTRQRVREVKEKAEHDTRNKNKQPNEDMRSNRPGGPVLPDDSRTPIPETHGWSKDDVLPYTKEIVDVRGNIEQLGDIYKNLEDEQLYAIEGRHGYFTGSQIKEMIDPILIELSASESTYVTEQEKYKNLPNYWKWRRTETGYEYYVNPKLKEKYDEKVLSEQPLPTQIFRRGTQLFWTGAGLIFKTIEAGQNIFKTGAETVFNLGGDISRGEKPSLSTKEFIDIYKPAISMQKEYENTKRWEQQLYETGQRKDWMGATFQLATSPTAVSVYTYGAISVGSSVVSKYVAPKVVPKVKSYFEFSKNWLKENVGSRIPSSITSYPEKFTDIKFAKYSWRQISNRSFYVSQQIDIRGDILLSGRPAYGKLQISYYQRAFTSLETRLYAPIYGTPSKYTSWVEQQAIRNLKTIKLDLLKTPSPVAPEIQTKTFIYTETPGKGITFESYVKGKDIYASGTIKPQGELVKIEGEVYWKLSPENVFYQRSPFSSVSQSKYIGDIGDYSVARVQGLSVPMEEVRVTLYGHWRTEIGTGIYQPRWTPTSSSGATIWKKYYAGDTFVGKTGTLESIDFDITTGMSHGTFTRDNIIGRYTDIFTIRSHPESQIKNMYKPGVGDLGFNYQSVSKEISKPLVMPGGIGVHMKTESLKDLLRVFPKMGGKTSLTESFLEQSSVSWVGTTPVIISTSMKKLFFESSLMMSTISLSSLKRGNFLKQNLRQREIQIVIPKTSQTNIMGLKNIQALTTVSLTETAKVNIVDLKTVSIPKFDIPIPPKGGETIPIETVIVENVIPFEEVPPVPVPFIYPKSGLGGGGRGGFDWYWYDERKRFRMVKTFDPFDFMFGKTKKSKKKKRRKK